MESLRAIAALCILGFHAVFASGLAESGSWLLQYASRLEVGVSVFFVISGFLLYRPFARAHLERGPQPAISRYAISRLLRIVPAYWVALALIGLWIGLDGIFDWPGSLVYFGFLQSYDPDTLRGGLLQAWSLGVEVTYYIFLPVFALAISRLPAANAAARWRNQWLGVGLLFALGIGWNALVLASVGVDSEASASLLSSLPAYLDQFALGMGLALVALSAGRRRGPARGEVGSAGALLCVGVALAAFWVASTRIGLEGGFEQITPLQAFVKHVLFSVVAISLLVAAGLGVGSGPVARVLGWRPLRWLGLVSYGIFLWHLAVLAQLREWDLGLGSDGAGWLGWFAVALVPSAVIAAGSWYLIERPALGLRDTVAGVLRGWWRRRPRASA